MRIGVDIGGTFTDFALYDEETGVLSNFKLLSTAHDPSEAVIRGLERMAPAVRRAIVHGSTVATNALLERKGARTAFITTAGFKDLLTIGRQNRDKLYDFKADRPQPLVQRKHCVEVSERVDHQGRVLTPLSQEEVHALPELLRSHGIESVAVCLLFSFLVPDHEKEVGAPLRQAGFPVSLSSEILPEFREYERASTTVVNAYLAPLVDGYLGRLEAAFPGSDLRIIQSNGGSALASEARRQSVRTVFSGPAGGVTGAMHVARSAGLDRVITFDMGGTSTDVSLCLGGPRLTSEGEVGGIPIRVPMVDIHTVGSGGGSVAFVDEGGALRVGPESAGAHPGPVCYGLGGTRPTVTDANLILGRLPGDYFLGGEMSLHEGPARRALAEMGQRAGLVAPAGLDLAQAAALGVIQVVNAQMERALRVISTERGHDPRDFTLICFGGAGALHACDLARALGIRNVLVPAAASTLSALGMLCADVVKDYVRTVMLPGETTPADLERLFAALEARGTQHVLDQGVARSSIRLERSLDMRYVGQSYELAVPLTENFRQDFHHAHEQAYGHSHPQAPTEIVNIRLRAVGRVEPPRIAQQPLGEADPSSAFIGDRPLVLPREDGQAASASCVPFYLGDRLRPGHTIVGPAVLAMEDTTVFLPGRDRMIVDTLGNLRIEVA